jgi:hypothetical protein
MSRQPHHVHNPYSRRILCQRCHKSPASYSLLHSIRLCSTCSRLTFPSLHQLTLSLLLPHKGA